MAFSLGSANSPFNSYRFYPIKTTPTGGLPA